MTEVRVPTATKRYSLRRGVYLVRAKDQTAQLNAWPHAERIGIPTEMQLSLLRELAQGGVTVVDGVVDDGERGAFLDRLERGGWLDAGYEWKGRRLLTVRALGPAPRDAPELAPAGRLHPGVVMTPGEEGVVVELPGGWCDLAVHDGEALAVLTGMAVSVDDEVRRTVLNAAGSAGVLDQVAAEPASFAEAQWKTHERWFHERSRLSARGYFGDQFGGTFWARGQYEPLPARPAAAGDHRFPLPGVDLAGLRRSDPPLTAVLEDRASIREHDDDHPLVLAQLGEFLYRTSRVRFTREAEGLEYSNRPYPSGGSMYELEVYPVIRLVEGVDSAMYHYDSHEHELVRVCGLEAAPVQRMLRVAAHSTVAWSQPQVLLVISARVGRIMWKYEAMAYALVLKHVGVLYQTMYTVATAMELAACAVGSGDAHAFSEATDRDPAAEPSVGEFLLGSRRANVPIWEM